MIPKKIHYCWFGHNPKSQNVLKYIDTWKKYFPDYEIKEWNENNFDVNKLNFTREAYFAKKYAFVSDVCRLYALYTEGGIYFDTDIIVLKRFPEDILSHKAFAGFEHEIYIGTGIIGSEKNNVIIKQFLSLYNDMHFFRKFRFNLSPNVILFTKILVEHGLKRDNSYQDLNEITIYPQNIFCCKDCRTKEYYNNSDSLSIHDFSGLWTDEKDTLRNKIKVCLKEFETIIKYIIYSK